MTEDTLQKLLSGELTVSELSDEVCRVILRHIIKVLRQQKQ